MAVERKFADQPWRPTAWYTRQSATFAPRPNWWRPTYQRDRLSTWRLLLQNHPGWPRSPTIRNGGSPQKRRVPGSRLYTFEPEVGASKKDGWCRVSDRRR